MVKIRVYLLELLDYKRYLLWKAKKNVSKLLLSIINMLTLSFQKDKSLSIFDVFPFLTWSKWGIVVLCPIVDDQFSFCKEKAVWFDFPGRARNLLLFLLGEFGQLILELPRVCAIRHHKSKFERVVANDAPSEVMPLTHFHIIDFLWPNTEIHHETHWAEMEKIWTQVVLYEACWRIIVVCESLLALSLVIANFNEGDVRDHVPYPKASKLKLGPVVAQFAKKTLSGTRERFHILNCDIFLRRVLLLFWNYFHLF